MTSGGFSVGEGSVTFTVLNGTTTVGTASASVTAGQAKRSFTLTAGTAANTYKIHAAYTDPTPGNFSGSSGNATLTVSQPAPSITWANPADITYGTALSATQLDATASVPGNGTYSPAAGTVLGAGSSQPLTFNFTPTDTNDYSTGTDTVHINVLQAAPSFSNLSASQSITYGTATISLSGKLTAPSIIPAGKTVTITIGAATTTATVLANGSFSATIDTHALAPAATAYPIVYAYAGDSNFKAASDSSTTLAVNKAAPAITWANPTAITYGTALSGTQLNATASVPGNGTYTPPAGTVLAAGSNQPLTFNFTPTDTTDYSTVTDTVQISVGQAVPKFTGLSASQTITYDQSTIFVQGTLGAATATPSGQKISIAVGGTTITPTILADGPFSATIDTHALNAAATPYLISYSYAGDANFQPANDASTSLTVNKAAPAITWANPADIAYGTALSVTQLDATASVPGSGSYSPCAGAILDVGSNQPLTFNFTPTDTTNETTASSIVHINMVKATPSFSQLTPSQSIEVGQATLSLSGKLAAPSAAAAGVLVTIVVGSATGSATTLADGTFTAAIDTHAWVSRRRPTRSPTASRAIRTSRRPATQPRASP